MIEDFELSKYDDVKEFVDVLGFCKYCKNKFDKHIFN